MHYLLTQSVRYAIARDAQIYSKLSDQPGRYNRTASYLKTQGLARNRAEDQLSRMNTLRRGPMSPQESLPAPLTGTVRVNGLTLTGCVMLIRERMAQSKGED